MTYAPPSGGGTSEVSDMTIWRTTAAGLATVTILLASACGSTEESARSKPSPTASVAPSFTPETPKKGALQISFHPELGPVLLDAKGFTLYRFTKDTTDPSKSACEDECAKTWLPVPAEGVSLPPGVPASLLGVLQRPDGTEQLTLGGIPAYRYSKDVRPGDLKGEGIGGTWFASLPKDGFPGLEKALAEYQKNLQGSPATR